MQLSLEFTGTALPAQERIRLETLARNVILEMSNGVENAHKAYQAFQTGADRGPMGDWARMVRYAADAARGHMSPSVGQRVGILARFEQ